MTLLLLLVSWEQAFAAPAHDPSVHFRASYFDGRPHTLEVWRDGDRRLRRQTDGRLNLYGERRGRDFAYHLADSSRKVLVHVAGSNLHRLGIFEGWTELSHIVVRPRGTYEIRAGKRARDCRWYAIGSRQICWSVRYALPLVITDAGKTVFSVQEIHTGPIDARAFALPTGLAEVDANEDLDPSVD